MPVRNAASMTENAYVVTCRKSASTRNHTTSSASDAKPDTANTTSRRRRSASGTGASAGSGAAGAVPAAACSRARDSRTAARPTATFSAAASRNETAMPRPPIIQNPASSVPAMPPAVFAA